MKNKDCKRKKSHKIRIRSFHFKAADEADFYVFIKMFLFIALSFRRAVLKISYFLFCSHLLRA